MAGHENFLGYISWLLRVLGTSAERVRKEDGLEDRLRLQKAAFLLKHLGVAPFTLFNFNLYVRGPYSPDLAECYYHLEAETALVEAKLDREKEELLNWFISHDSKWLEIASSIISIKRTYREIDEDEVYSILKMSKPWVDQQKFTAICRELKNRRLI